MKDYARNINYKKFFLNIILPTVLTIGLFIVLIFSFIIPYFEQNMLNSKKEMISELVNTTIGIASKYEQEAAAGLISSEEAKQKALSRIEHLRYGIHGKDYFWITDTIPVMIMHPYRSDLNGKDLSNFKDPNGKRLFVEMVDQAKFSGKGYVDYMWQWMDDSAHIVPKISYVKVFKPWGWIVGTGIYIEDVRREISAIEEKLTWVLLGISAIMALLLSLIVRQNLRTEIKRIVAEKDLKISREKYKALVEASTEGTGMFLDGPCIYSNKKLLDMFKAESLDYIGDDLSKLLDTDSVEDKETVLNFLAGNSNYLQIETKLSNKEHESFGALFSISKITLSEKKGFIIVVKELIQPDEDVLRINECRKQLLVLSEQIIDCKVLNASEILIENIHKAGSVNELEEIYKSLPFYISALIESGSRSSSVTRSVTAVNDAITKKVAEIIIEQIGAPPVPFAFVALGSEGREEQTLFTDQDNAIIYSDVQENNQAEVHDYFLRFGEKICCMLDKIGYNFCQGNVMAQNPAWCQSLSSWKKYFADWISKSEPQNLVDVQIFFDFRCIYGDNELTLKLREHIGSVLKNNSAFFGHMARVCISYKTPLTIFGKIQTDDEHVDNINIKNPLRVIVNLVRLYAIHNNLSETNTIKRLNHLDEKKIFSSAFYNDLIYALDFLMLLQFKHQSSAWSLNSKVDNYITLSNLSTIEVNTLKYVFTQLSVFQSKIKYDFGVSE